MADWKSGKCAFCKRTYWSGSHDPALGRPKPHLFINRDLLLNVSHAPSAWTKVFKPVRKLVALPDLDPVGLPYADDRLDLVAAA